MHDKQWSLTVFEKFIDTISDSTLLLTFKKLPLVDFWYIIKEDPKLPEKIIKILLSFPAAYLYEAGFSSYTSSKTTYHRD